MKIRAAATGENRSAGNTFIAVDDLENRLGSCRVDPFFLGDMMPDRPFEVRISAGGDGSAMMQLLGTAVARAMVLAKESGQSARIYAECAPQEIMKLKLYKTVGLTDDDALVRMSRCVVPGGSVAKTPENCVIIEDDLTDSRERAFFLERQRKLFGRENAAQWLEEIGRKPMMRRILVASRSGLVGELVCWAENGDGHIGYIYTAPAWRRKGVAVCLIEAARQYFYQCRLKESHIDVRLRQKPMMSVAATAGYRQSEVLMRLPGMDLDGPKRSWL